MYPPVAVNRSVNYRYHKQNKGLFVFDTVFIRTIIWLTLSGSPGNGPDKDECRTFRPTDVST
jgi:hypothetical protein